MLRNCRDVGCMHTGYFDEYVSFKIDGIQFHHIDARNKYYGIFREI